MLCGEKGLLIRQIAYIFSGNFLLHVIRKVGFNLRRSDVLIHVILCILHAEQIEELIKLCFPSRTETGFIFFGQGIGFRLESADRILA